MSVKSSASRSGLCTRQKTPPVLRHQAAAATTSASVQPFSERATALDSVPEAMPLPSGKYGGLQTARP